MRPTVQTFFDPATFTATHLVSDPATGMAALIDPVLDYEPKWARVSAGSADAVLLAVADQGLKLLYVLETHAHADHLSAADYIRLKTGTKVAIGARITEVQKVFIPLFDADDLKPDGAQFDLLLTDESTLELGELRIGVMQTPGHTPACVTYLIGDAAFTGDTMFMPDYGTARTDFPGGEARTLYRSIRAILDLPPATRLFLGHDYLPPKGRNFPAWETTVVDQRAHNLHIHDGITEDAFVALREARNALLAPPTLILPSLQVNIRAGALPPAGKSGQVFLKLPVTVANAV